VAAIDVTGAVRRNIFFGYGRRHCCHRRRRRRCNAD